MSNLAVSFFLWCKELQRLNNLFMMILYPGVFSDFFLPDTLHLRRSMISVPWRSTALHEKISDRYGVVVRSTLSASLFISKECEYYTFS